MAEQSSAPKRRRRHTLMKEDRVCQVCGDSATNYNFGVLSCEACKAFFRRNASQHSSIKCAFNEMCLSMTSKNTRRRCSACRLKLCFERGMTCDFLKQKSAPVSSTSTDADESQPSCSSEIRSPDAAVPLMLAQVDGFAVNLEHYMSLADMESDLRLSSAHCLEIEALGIILAETVGEAGWTLEGSAGVHFPSALDAPSFNWPTMLCLVDAVTRRLDAYLRRYSELSSWNLHEHLLPTIKKRLPSILIPLHLPSYHEVDCSFHTVIDGLCVSINPRQLQQWIYLHKQHIASHTCLVNLVVYIEKLYALLGNDKELCALFTCVKLFLHFDPTSDFDEEADIGCCSSVGGTLDDPLPPTLTADLFERFENHLFELCSLLSVKHPQDFGERFKLLLNLLSWSQSFDDSLASLIGSMMLEGTESRGK